MEKAKEPHWHDTEEGIEERRKLFDEIVVPNMELVRRLSVRFSRRRQDENENYNECLINLYRYIHTYDPSKPFVNWAYVCCKRLVNDLNKKRASFKVADRVNPENFVSHYAESPSEESCNHMGLDNYRTLYSDSVLGAIDRLNPIYSEVLLLQQAGYSLEEITRMVYRNGTLNTPNVETVKSRLFLAKMRMRKMIDHCGNGRDE